MKILSWIRGNMKYLQTVLTRAKASEGRLWHKFNEELPILLAAISRTQFEVTAEDIKTELELRKLLELKTDKKAEDREAAVVWHLDHLDAQENLKTKPSAGGVWDVCKQLMIVIVLLTLFSSLATQFNLFSLFRA